MKAAGDVPKMNLKENWTFMQSNGQEIEKKETADNNVRNVNGKKRQGETPGSLN